MVKYEEIVINNQKLIKAYSDKKLYIQKVGTNEIYSSATDLECMNYKYEETDIEIGAKPDKVPTVNLLNKMFLKR